MRISGANNNIKILYVFLLVSSQFMKKKKIYIYSAFCIVLKTLVQSLGIQTALCLVETSENATKSYQLNQL